MIGRRFLPVMAALALMAALWTPTSAAAVVTVSPHTARVGGKITVTGRGLRPRTFVSVELVVQVTRGRAFSQFLCCSRVTDARGGLTVRTSVPAKLKVCGRASVWVFSPRGEQKPVGGKVTVTGCKGPKPPKPPGH